jgi:hypothetical protein
METAASHKVEQEHHRPRGSHDQRSAGRFDTKFAAVCTRMVILRPTHSGIYLSLHEVAVVTKEIISEKEARELFRM